MAVPLAAAVGEALALAAGTILAEVFAELVELGLAVAEEVGVALAEELALAEGLRARRRNGRAGRAVGLVEQHLAEHEQGGLAHQLDRLLRPLARHRHDEQVGALRLDLGTGVAGAVDP